ncbi:MAG: SDR family NAD(P)-dependent oxidoreductase, partial [Daejeonella sp.]
MNKKLEGKLIIVTGGSGLLGCAIVKRLKEESSIVINLEIGVENTDDLSLVNCDITKPESIDQALYLVIQKYGRINGLVNNAYPRTADWGKKFEDIDYASWQKNVDWQLNSYFYFCQQASKQMALQKDGGSIVNLASVYGVVGP